MADQRAEVDHGNTDGTTTGDDVSEPMERADLLGVLIEALSDDDLSRANEDVLEGARKVANYFQAQGIEVRRG